MMIAHVWHLNRDPEVYGADAAHFNPARFMDASGEVVKSCAPETKEEGHFTYGFGRRVCVGKHVANNSLFIDFAMMLWACTIEPGKDEKGNVIPIDVDGCIEDGLVVWVFLRTTIVEPSRLTVLMAARRPVPFKVDISPRFPEAVTLLASENEHQSH
jgi:hypothetical protein